MSIPNFSTLARSIFNQYPADGQRLNELCDQCEADRAAYGEADPRVQEGEVRVNALKGLFTRRIAWACYNQDRRFGLRKKSVGAMATRPSDGVTHATDVLMLADTGAIIDVMSDRGPSWGTNPDDTQPLDQWLLPVAEDVLPAPVPVPLPTPTPDPVPVPVPTPEPDDAMENLFSLLDALHRDNVAAMAIAREAVAEVKALRDEIGSLKFPSVPKSYVGKIPYLGTITLVPQY